MDEQDADDGSARTSALLRERFRANAENLTRAERQVIDHLLRIAPSELAFVSAAGIAEATGTSDATVIRAARRLGFSGLPELKRQATRAIAARMPISRRLEQRVKVVGADIGKAREAVFAAAQEVLESTDEALDRTALDAAVSLLQSVETVWCLGLGGAEVPARHCAIRLARAGLRSRVTGSAGFSLASEMIDLRPGDALIIFQALERLDDIETIIDYARRIGARTLLISGNQLRERYLDKVDVSLVCVGVRSMLASWAIGAITVVDLLVHCLIARDPARAVETHALLDNLRQRFR